MVALRKWLQSVALCSALSRVVSATEELAEPTRSCLAADDVLRGTANRSFTKVILGWRFWASQQLIAKLAEIVMREMLGYDVSIVAAAYQTFEWFHDLNEGVFDVSLEQWYAPVTGADYIKYIVTDRSVHHVSFLGYVGRTGVYTSQFAVDIDPYAAYYKFYQNVTRATEIGFVTHGESVAQEVAVGWPVCNTTSFGWCGTGQFEGYWATPECYDGPDSCVEFIHVSPWWEQANLEMMSKSNNLRLVFSYVGENSIVQQQLVERISVGKYQLFYYWEPDAFLARSDVRGTRVQFPDYYIGCDRGNNRNPNTGIRSCDLAEDPLQNFVAARLRTNAPEAYYFTSKLFITPDQINGMIRSTMQDGGGLDLFDAACEFLHGNKQTFLEYAPDCIRHTPEVVQNGDVVFNADSLSCWNATILQVAAPATCVEKVLSADADRKDTKITLVSRNWLTHELVTAVTEVLLRTYLGYTVESRINNVTASIMWGNDMTNLGLYDIDMESWQVVEGSASYATYVESGLVQLAGLIGFSGRSGVFVSNAALETATFADYYRFYQNMTSAAAQGLLMHDSTRFTGSECREDWCGTGALESFWAPSFCRSSPGTCGQLMHITTFFDTAYVEQLLQQNDVHLVVGYFGNEAERMIRSYVQAESLVPFYWWEPDPLVLQLDVSRLSFPDNYKGCGLANTFNPNTGSVACDFPEVSPMKIFTASLLTSAPEAYYLIDLVQFNRDELEGMMSLHVSAGGSMTTEGLACHWISANNDTLQKWAPECLRNPIPFEDLTVDSTVFDPTERLCGAVKQCPSNSILRFINVFICEECGPGDVPDAAQKTCITCLPGFAENANGSACVGCPLGKAKDIGEVTCLDCAAGFYTDVTGKSQCDLCTGATFQSSQGQTSCRSCDEQFVGSTAFIGGAMSKEQCDCPAGTYLPLDSLTCTACPNGFVCTQGAKARHFPLLGTGSNGTASAYPVVEYGYMTLAGKPLTAYLCNEKEHCPGGAPGTCAAFRDSSKVACGECQDGAYESGTECKECGGTDFLPLVIVVVSALFLVFLFVRFFNGNILMKSSRVLLMSILCGLIMTSMQTLTVFRQMGVNWTSPFQAILSTLSFITFDLEVVRLGCLLGPSPVQGYLLRQCVAPVGTITLLILLRVKKFFLPKMKLQNEFINTTGTLFNVFFISIVVSAVAPHVCYEHPGDAGRSVISDPSILCDYRGKHMSVVVIGCIATLCVPAPFLGLVAYGVLQYPSVVKQSIKSDDFLAAFRFLFVRFLPEVYWFAIIVAGRNLLTCLIPVFLRDAAAQVMGMALLQCSYVVVQQTCRPWRSLIVNFVDVAMGIGLVLLLLAISVLTDFSQGTAAVEATGLISILCLLFCPASVLVYAQFKTWRTSFFEHFICHHKAGAGGQARLLKMLLMARHGKNVFIDSDNLVELDGLFDIVKTKVRVLVVYLSRDTLTRPWCVGEICTSFECGKKIVTVQTGSFELPDAVNSDMAELIDRTGCNLQEQGISDELVARSLRHMLSDEIPTILLDDFCMGGAKFMKVAQQLLEPSLFKTATTNPMPRSTRSSNTSAASENSSGWPVGAWNVAHPKKQHTNIQEGCLLACANPSDDEALAAVSILLMKAKDQVAALGVSSVVNVTDFAGATDHTELLEVVRVGCQRARAVVSVLTRRSLEVFLEVNMIAGGMAASCTMIPVSTWDFSFPNALYYAHDLPRIWPSQNAMPLAEAEVNIRSFFKLITVFVATIGSDQVLTVNIATVVSRIPKDASKLRSSTSSAALVAASAQRPDSPATLHEAQEQRFQMIRPVELEKPDNEAEQVDWSEGSVDDFEF